jgi:hypothetical protein
LDSLDTNKNANKLLGCQQLAADGGELIIALNV